MPIATVKQLCTPSAIVKSDSLVEQVAQIEDFASGKVDGRAFFQRNYFTQGLELLVRRGFERLAGKSEDGAFYLTQAMGGGKTHSLIAFGLLAADPALRREIVPRFASGAEFGPAKVVIFNGHQNPATLLWGYIADQLGRGEVMAPFWRNGAKTPGVDEWVAILGNEPILILLDELPSYLQMAQGEPVGATTLGDLTIGALERLFNALPRCPRACVVVTNLKDDVYLAGAGQLQKLIDDLTKQYDKHAQAITPVQQNTGEVFEIVRKRLFDGLPAADRIDEVAQAYVGALQKAKRVDTIPSTPETFIERIRRAQEGFDAIFVDEFHLYNAVERGIFLPLLKKRDAAPAILMAYDVQQSPREAFLGLASNIVQVAVGSFSVTKAEKIRLTDIFRYTPEIAAVLRHISHANPIDGIDSSWLSADAKSRLPAGAKPIAMKFRSTEELYDFAFDAAKEAAKKGAFRETAVLSLSYPIFDQIKKAGKYRDKIFVIDSREDLMKIQYAGKRVIFSSPEYVSGFQFESVFVCDVNLNDETGNRTTWQSRRFASLLYLAASRAKRRLYLLGDNSYGGLSEIIVSGVAQGLVESNMR